MQEGSRLFAVLPREGRLEIWKDLIGGVDFNFYQLVEKGMCKRRDVAVYVDKSSIIPTDERSPFIDQVSTVYQDSNVGPRSEAPASCDLLESPGREGGFLSLAFKCRIA